MTSPIFILAGEPSGDQLAAHIMRAVNHHYQSPAWIGVGGALMQDEGLSSLVDIETMSIMGFRCHSSLSASVSTCRQTC